MSFRTDAVRQVGFDETLGYGVGYAYHEDLDVSLRLERPRLRTRVGRRREGLPLFIPGKAR